MMGKKAKINYVVDVIILIMFVISTLSGFGLMRPKEERAVGTQIIISKYRVVIIDLHIISVIAKLRKKQITKVTLMPLMFVAGDHAQNDMDSDEEDSWKTILTNEGFTVETYLHGMGENAVIRSIYLQHIKDAIKGGSHPHHG